MTSTLLRNARQILTLAGETGPRSGAAMSDLGIIEGGSVLIMGDKIGKIGADKEVCASVEGEVLEIDCAGKTIMPALIDSHTHLVWGGSRVDELEMRLAGADYEDIFAAGGGILSSVRQTRAASEDELLDQSMARIRRMQRAGTTSFEIKSGYGLDLETELRQLRVVRRLRDSGLRVRSTCLAAHAIPAEFRGSRSARAKFVEVICAEILPAVAAADLADDCDVFCDRGAFTAAEARRILHRADDLGMGIRVHANEFGHTGGARVAAEFHALSADHLLHLDDDEREALRASNVIATLLPGTSTVLGKPFADGRALVDACVPVAIATDCNPGSCAFENLAMVLALACYGCHLSPAEAICAVTHNAAASLKLTNEVGRLAQGMSADLIILDSPDHRDLVYHAGSPLIGAVYQRGRRLPSPN